MLVSEAADQNNDLAVEFRAVQGICSFTLYLHFSLNFRNQQPWLRFSGFSPGDYLARLLEIIQLFRLPVHSPSSRRCGDLPQTQR